MKNDAKNATNPKCKPFLDIIIPEQPIAMQRPRLRLTATSGFAPSSHVYNPQAAEKVRLGWIFKEAMTRLRLSASSGFVGPSTKPLSVHMIFLFKRCKSNKRIYNTARPDLDNIAKFYLDAMSNDIVYHDDSAIIELMCAKGYAENPSVHIVIYEI